jgi:hypothetical protein
MTTIRIKPLSKQRHTASSKLKDTFMDPTNVSNCFNDKNENVNIGKCRKCAELGMSHVESEPDSVPKSSCGTEDGASSKLKDTFMDPTNVSTTKMSMSYSEIARKCVELG